MPAQKVTKKGDPPSLPLEGILFLKKKKVIFYSDKEAERIVFLLHEASEEDLHDVMW
jgi:hypothetical protein